MNRSLNVRTIAILYFFLFSGCGDSQLNVFQRIADTLDVSLETSVVWRFSVDDGSEETWEFTPTSSEGERTLSLTRRATLGGITLPNPRQDLYRIDALGLTWLRQGDCAVQSPPCRRLISEPLLLRVPFPSVMELETTEVQIEPTVSTTGRLRTRGEQDGLHFEFTYGWNWDGDGEGVWRLETGAGVQEFTEVIAGGSPRLGTRL